jgi:uncharacterized membrane protein YuzA (DUF378 family)
MATMQPPITERRHIPDRRATGSALSETGAKRMTAADWIPMILLAVGGINWGLIGLFNFNLVATLFGEASLLTRFIYIAVGVSALYSIYLSSKMSSKYRSRT